MKTILVYFSRFGHTKMISETIAKELELNGTTYVIDCEHFPDYSLDQIDMLVKGTPTHNMNLPEEVKPILSELPAHVLRDKFYAVFDTSYKMSPFLARFTAAKKLDRKLRKLGGIRLVNPESFYVMEREGPLYEGEIERARKWAESVTEVMRIKIN